MECFTYRVHSSSAWSNDGTLSSSSLPIIQISLVSNWCDNTLYKVEAGVKKKKDEEVRHPTPTTTPHTHLLSYSLSLSLTPLHTNGMITQIAPLWNNSIHDKNLITGRSYTLSALMHLISHNGGEEHFYDPSHYRCILGTVIGKRPQC